MNEDRIIEAKMYSKYWKSPVFNCFRWILRPNSECQPYIYKECMIVIYSTTPLFVFYMLLRSLQNGKHSLVY